MIGGLAQALAQDLAVCSHSSPALPLKKRLLGGTEQLSYDPVADRGTEVKSQSSSRFPGGVALFQASHPYAVCCCRRVAVRFVDCFFPRPVKYQSSRVVGDRGICVRLGAWSRWSRCGEQCLCLPTAPPFRVPSFSVLPAPFALAPPVIVRGLGCGHQTQSLSSELTDKKWGGHGTAGHVLEVAPRKGQM